MPVTNVTPVTNVLYIDGVLMPTPTSITPQFNRLWAQDSGRTASGLWVGDIQAEKWRIDATWKYISRDDVKTLMEALYSSAYVTVKFHCPLTDKEKSITAYSSDVKLPVYSYALNHIMYEDFSISIVER